MKIKETTEIKTKEEAEADDMGVVQYDYTNAIKMLKAYAKEKTYEKK